MAIFLFSLVSLLYTQIHDHSEVCAERMWSKVKIVPPPGGKIKNKKRGAKTTCCWGESKSIVVLKVYGSRSKPLFLSETGAFEGGI